MGRKKEAFDSTFPLLAGGMFLVALMLLLEVFFQVSRVSQFSKLSVYKQIALPLNSFVFLSIPIIMLWLLLFVCSLVFHKNQTALRGLHYGSSFFLFLLFLVIVFFHIDTLFYTAVKSNVYSLPLSANLILLFLLVDVAALLVIKKGQRVTDYISGRSKKLLVALLIMFAVSLFFVSQRVYAAWREVSTMGKELAARGRLDSRPNIILISADSLDSRRLGAYDYIRDTTPNLSSLQDILIYNRAYTNCGNSRGSIISILTGKSPLTTKLIFPPDILHGDDAFQHLPNILAGLGYYNVDLNDGFYASPVKSNIRDGFHQENSHKIDFATGLGFRKKMRVAFSDETYFLKNLLETYWNKIYFMVGGSPQLFDYARFLKWGEGSDWTDAKRVETLNEVIRKSDQPIFAHIHLVSTHGPLFMSPIRKFSITAYSDDSPEATALLEEQRRQYYSKKAVLEKFDITFDHYEVPIGEQEKNWNLYDDAVLSVDYYFGEILRTLQEAGKLADTLIVFFTDHGMGYFTTDLDKVRYPLPLVVRLPGVQSPMTIDEPVQYIDIAPSILNYLGQSVPAWMEGNIIFGKAMDEVRIPSRSLVSAGFVSENTKVRGGIGANVSKIDVGPPYFGIDLMGLTADDKYYLYSTELKSGGLYDISGNPYDFRVISDRDLVREYHTRLYRQLENKGIRIEREPE